jgi:hypothetical protein
MIIGRSQAESILKVIFSESAGPPRMHAANKRGQLAGDNLFGEYSPAAATRVEQREPSPQL